MNLKKYGDIIMTYDHDINTITYLTSLLIYINLAQEKKTNHYPQNIKLQLNNIRTQHKTQTNKNHNNYHNNYYNNHHKNITTNNYGGRTQKKQTGTNKKKKRTYSQEPYHNHHKHKGKGRNHWIRKESRQKRSKQYKRKIKQQQKKQQKKGQKQKHKHAHRPKRKCGCYKDKPADGYYCRLYENDKKISHKKLRKYRDHLRKCFKKQYKKKYPRKYKKGHLEKALDNEELTITMYYKKDQRQLRIHFHKKYRELYEEVAHKAFSQLKKYHIKHEGWRWDFNYCNTDDRIENNQQLGEKGTIRVPFPTQVEKEEEEEKELEIEWIEPQEPEECIEPEDQPTNKRIRLHPKPEIKEYHKQKKVHYIIIEHVTLQQWEKQIAPYIRTVIKSKKTTIKHPEAWLQQYNNNTNDMMVIIKGEKMQEINTILKDMRAVGILNHQNDINNITKKKYHQLRKITNTHQAKKAIIKGSKTMQDCEECEQLITQFNNKKKDLKWKK